MTYDIENASFDEPGITPPEMIRSFDRDDPDEPAAIPGWTIEQNGVELRALRPQERPHGSRATQALRLKNLQNELGIICQTVDTVPEQPVHLAWMDSPDFAPHEAGYGDQQQYAITVEPVYDPDQGKQSVVESPNYGSPQGPSAEGPNWTKKRIEFTPTTSRTEVRFRSRVEGPLCAYITDIRFEASRTPVLTRVYPPDVENGGPVMFDGSDLGLVHWAIFRDRDGKRVVVAARGENEGRTARVEQLPGGLARGPGHVSLSTARSREEISPENTSNELDMEFVLP
ncbi:hypothetical protein [Embleya sp. NPDC059237]|uniref:hypothetical protein n=1 Tax=Embleya sp. NPDC059237 TaxID=3346784 RepID=UPI003695DA81